MENKTFEQVQEEIEQLSIEVAETVEAIQECPPPTELNNLLFNLQQMTGEISELYKWYVTYFYKTRYQLHLLFGTEIEPFTFTINKEGK